MIIFNSLFPAAGGTYLRTSVMQDGKGSSTLVSPFSTIDNTSCMRFYFFLAVSASFLHCTTTISESQSQRLSVKQSYCFLHTKCLFTSSESESRNEVEKDPRTIKKDKKQTINIKERFSWCELVLADTKAGPTSIKRYLH